MNLVEGNVCNKLNENISYSMGIDIEEENSKDIFDTHIISQCNEDHQEILNDLNELNYDNFDEHFNNRLNESDVTICELVQDNWTESNQQNLLFESPINLFNTEKIEEISEIKVSTPNRKGHRVNFPDVIVTAYVPALMPWVSESVSSTTNLVDAYSTACNKYSIGINSNILFQLQQIFNFNERYDILNLTNINIDWKQCEALEEIFKLIQFKTITLDGAKLDDESSVIFFDLIRYYESCNNLFLYNDNNFGFFGWEACGRYIQHATCLLHLKSVNSIILEQAINSLQKGIRQSFSLNILHLEGCIKSGRMLHLLASASEQCKTLKELKLCANNLSSADGTHISYIILQNKNLEHLDLRTNNLQDMGINYICNVFTAFTKLKYLNLSENALTDSCSGSLASMLKVTKYLDNLILSKNNINDTGIGILNDALKDNISLSKIDLSFTQLSCKSVISLTNILTNGFSGLLEVNLNGNVIHEEIKEYLEYIFVQRSLALRTSNIDKENSLNISNLNNLKIDNYNDKIESPKILNDDIINIKYIENNENPKSLNIPLKSISCCKECIINEENDCSSIATLSLIANNNESQPLTTPCLLEKNSPIVNAPKIEASPNIKKRKFAVFKAKLDPS